MRPRTFRAVARREGENMDYGGWGSPSSLVGGVRRHWNWHPAYAVNSVVDEVPRLKPTSNVGLSSVHNISGIPGCVVYRKWLY